MFAGERLACMAKPHNNANQLFQETNVGRGTIHVCFVKVAWPSLKLTNKLGHAFAAILGRWSVDERDRSGCI